MITSLTKTQEKKLRDFRVEWFSVGICTERADRKTTEAAILSMRHRIGVSENPIFIWCQSPATCLLALEVLKDKKFTSKLKRNSLRASLWASLRASLWASLRASLGNSWWGQHEAYWISFYLFCRDVLGVKYQEEKSNDLNLWRDIAKSCCWWWCYRNYVICSERPTIVTIDSRERIHNETGPCIAFADAWKVWAWHGLRIPDWIIEEPEKLSAKVILDEQNAEIRRCMIEKFTMARFLKESNAKVIDTAIQRHVVGGEEKVNELLSIDLPGDPEERLVALRVVCPSTLHEYMIRVPPDQKKVQSALAWSFNKTPEEYRPILET